MILVTGGTGHLGRDLIPQLTMRFGRVRALTRRERAPAPDIDWVVGDLASGAGLAEAMDGVRSVVHAATLSEIAQRGGLRPADLFSASSTVDVDGTRRLLTLARAAGVEHFLFVSIVGLERSWLPYSRVKLAAERLVRSADVPWTIVRATPFFYLTRALLAGLLRGPVAAVPRAWSNPVDTAEVAEYLAECVADGARGPREEMGGPETLPLSVFARQLRERLGWRGAILPVPLPVRIAEGLAVAASRGGRQGRVTFSQWLAREAPEAGPLSQPGE